jgi:hypothetical protein
VITNPNVITSPNLMTNPNLIYDHKITSAVTLTSVGARSSGANHVRRDHVFVRGGSTGFVAQSETFKPKVKNNLCSFL